MKIALKNLADTEWLGGLLWKTLPEKSLIFLNGELGAGKTALVRGVLRATGYNGAVKSPTFALVEEYELAKRKILHFDLYRLVDPEELEWIGIRDYLAQTSLCFIEWPRLGQDFLPKPDLEITLTIAGQSRIATVLSSMPAIEKNLHLSCKNKDLLL